MYTDAKELYARHGVDTDAAIRTALSIPISINCWQGDDVIGFEKGARALSGGIQTTGNYPGRARTPEELAADFEFAASFIPGVKKLNLHASYLVSGRDVDRDGIEPEDYRFWVDLAKRMGIGIDFNPTCFSHPMVVNNLTLSSPHKEVRDFWIEHCRRARRVAAYFAAETGNECVCNLWIPDGFKDTPADRLTPRLRLKEALDEIFSEKLEGVVDSVESKVFGIGVESFTVGSNEFYLGYAKGHPGVYQLLDSGHYHPTEVISEKISALLTQFDRIPLHVTRSVRWDSDHVVRLDDELCEIAKEIVRDKATDKVMIGLDFFDASINRIVAWIVGTNNMRKALLKALLEDEARLKADQEAEDYSHLFAYSEYMKQLPWSDVWRRLEEVELVKGGFDWYSDVKKYEEDVLLRRV